MKRNRGVNFKYSNDEMKPTKWNKIQTVISGFTTNSILLNLRSHPLRVDWPKHSQE